jgi:hypothetical protein
MQRVIEKLRAAFGVIPGVVLAILVGIAAFYFVTGGAILAPTFIGWLEGGDPAQHYLGWAFYRESPMLEWPLGANPHFGMELSSSVIYTDSLSLFALVFKYLGPILPDPFQYTGIWVLFCFVLQAVFAWKLVSLFTSNKYLPYLGSLFFLIAPVWLCRLGYHYSSLAQWAVLAGLYFYFRKRFSPVQWTLLLCTVVLLNTYIFIMVLALFGTDLLQRYLMKDISIPRAAVYFAIAFCCIILAAYSMGYFMIGKGVEGGGFGFYRMNVLSIFDPQMSHINDNDIWSLCLPDLGEREGDYEGFNYLGLGMIVLLPVALFFFIRNPRQAKRIRLVPIAILSVCCTIYALSNHVAFGGSEIFSYAIPSKLSFLVNSVRCSGRLFWPVYYLVYLGILYVIFSRFKPKTAAIICTAAFLVQALDSFVIWKNLRQSFDPSRTWDTPMMSPAWDAITKGRDKVIYVLPYIGAENADWMNMMEFAASRKMSINSGYFSRANRNVLNEMVVKCRADVANGRLKSDSVYVFDDDEMWKTAMCNLKSDDLAGYLDGFRVVVPYYFTSKDCDRSLQCAVTPDSAYDFNWNTGEISFRKGGNSERYAHGWSGPEDWGTWSLGGESFVVAHLAEAPAGDLEMYVDGGAFVSKKHPLQRVNVSVCGEGIGSIVYDEEYGNTMRKVVIPHDLIVKNGNWLRIRFEFEDAISPAELDNGDDDRCIAMALKRLFFRDAK